MPKKSKGKNAKIFTASVIIFLILFILFIMINVFIKGFSETMKSVIDYAVGFSFAGLAFAILVQLNKKYRWFK
ncbi:MAG: hypothetical protein ACE5RP_00220 [Nitrosopumilus sp.]